MDDVFYVVWCPNSGPPTVMHDNHHIAVAEAERLARHNPGHDFFVMVATDKFVKTDVQRTRLADPADVVPF